MSGLLPDVRPAWAHKKGRGQCNTGPVALTNLSNTPSKIPSVLLASRGEFLQAYALSSNIAYPISIRYYLSICCRV